MTLLESIEFRAGHTPGAPALSFETGIISYQDLHAQIWSTAAKLSPLTGQTVGIDLDNGPAWIVTDLACVTAGIVAVPLPPFFTADQRQHALSTAGASAILSDNSSGQKNLGSVAGTDVYLTILNNQTVDLPVGTSKITFTSGTTGQAKGVCLSQTGMETVATSIVEAVGEEPGKMAAAVLPLAVLLENVASAYPTLLAGGTYDVRPLADIGFTAGSMPDFMRFTAYLRGVQATSCILVPEILRGLMQASAQTGFGLPNMQFMAVGGSKVAPELLTQATSLGLPVFQGYGLSEAGSVVAVNTPDAQSSVSVGKLLSHAEVQISEDGEVLIYDPAFLGYVGSPREGELYATGDLGQIDDAGYLHITGRKKNVLITSMGRNISPEWPESELLTRPEIGQVIVIGDAQRYLSALIVPSNANVSPNDIQTAVYQINHKLPTYAQIRRWEMVAPFNLADGTLTGNARPIRAAITKRYQTLISNIYQSVAA